MSNNFNNNNNSFAQSNDEVKELIHSVEADLTLTFRKITHEFGNALTLINSSLQIIESSHPEVRDFKYWNSTMEDINYLIHLLKEVSFFNNSQNLNLSKTNIISILQPIIDTYNCMDNSGKVEVRLVTLNNIPPVSVDNVKIKQVFINLIKNSFEALDLSKPSYIHISLESNINNVIIKIKDNGCGIPADKINDIFKPMVTFKNNGTGLGLPISKKIIEAHNGTLSVCSNENEGTTFTVSLPL